MNFIRRIESNSGHSSLSVIFVTQRATNMVQNFTLGGNSFVSTGLGCVDWLTLMDGYCGRVGMGLGCSITCGYMTLHKISITPITINNSRSHVFVSPRIKFPRWSKSVSIERNASVCRTNTTVLLCAEAAENYTKENRQHRRRQRVDGHGEMMNVGEKVHIPSPTK